MILITGGLGYIGSHCVIKLIKLGYQVVIVDLCWPQGRDNYSKITRIVNQEVKLYEGNICHGDTLDRIFRENDISGVIHCAAFKSVGDSMVKPMSYYENNVGGTITLCQKMIEYNIKKLIFSSTAVVYQPADQATPESAPMAPVSVYGWTKLMAEQIMMDIARIQGWNLTIFRYFNVVGCEETGQLQDQSTTNLFSVIRQVVAGHLSHLHIFGTDYPTPDGTCIRDYISINDLVEAHVKVLNCAPGGLDGLNIYNLGSGHGYSVLEIVSAFNRQLEHNLQIKFADRRQGDPVLTLAETTRAQTELDWQPLETLDMMVASVLKGN